MQDQGSSVAEKYQTYKDFFDWLKINYNNIIFTEAKGIVNDNIEIIVNNLYNYCKDKEYQRCLEEKFKVDKRLQQLYKEQDLIQQIYNLMSEIGENTGKPLLYDTKKQKQRALRNLLLERKDEYEQCFKNIIIWYKNNRNNEKNNTEQSLLYEWVEDDEIQQTIIDEYNLRQLAEICYAKHKDIMLCYQNGLIPKHQKYITQKLNNCIFNKYIKII